MPGPLTLGAEPSLDQIAAAIRRMVGSQRGYPQYGYYTDETWDYVDPTTQGVDDHYMRHWTSSEPTIGRLWDFEINGQTALQGNNAGVFSAMPLSIDNQGDFTGPVTVGGALTVGGDTDIAGGLLVGLDTLLSGELEVLLDTLLQGNLRVILETQLDDPVGIGQAPIAATALAITGLVDVNGNIIPRADNAHDLGTAAKRWRDAYVKGLIADTTLLIVDPDANTITIDTTLMVADRNGDTVKFGSTPDLMIDTVNHRVGAGGIPVAAFDILNGPLRIGGTSAPASGEGLEFHYGVATNAATIIPFDRSGGVFGSLTINALLGNIMASSAIKIAWGAGGIAFYGGALAPQGTGGALTAGAAYGANEQTMINRIWNWLRAVSALT